MFNEALCAFLMLCLALSIASYNQILMPQQDLALMSVVVTLMLMVRLEFSFRFM